MMSSPSTCLNSASSSSKRVKSSAKRSRKAGAPSPPSAATFASARRSWTTSSENRSGASTLPSFGVITWTTVAAASSRTSRSRSESATASSRTLRSKGRDTSALETVSRNARSLSLSMSVESRKVAVGRLKRGQRAVSSVLAGKEARKRDPRPPVKGSLHGTAGRGADRLLQGGRRGGSKPGKRPRRQLQGQHRQAAIDAEPAAQGARGGVPEVGAGGPAARRRDGLRPRGGGAVVIDAGERRVH